MAKKEVVKVVKLQVKAGAANPSPPVGPALGQAGVNIMAFCKEFNDRTKSEDKDLVMPVEISVFKDKSFEFIIKTPPVPVLIMKELGLPKGSGVPNRDKVGKISRAQVEKIAKIKQADILGSELEAIMRMVIGTARSMGIDYQEEVA